MTDRAPDGAVSVLVGLLAALLLAVLSAAGPARAGAAGQEVTVHVFWAPGCPHCANARAALAEMTAADPALRLHEVELGTSPANHALFVKLLTLFEIDRPGVPFVVIGPRSVTGFSAEAGTPADYAALIAACRSRGCTDIAAALAHLSDLAAGRIADPVIPTGAPGLPGTESAPEPRAAPPAVLERRMRLPLVGELALADLSLPALTVVLAGIDGFNPCAMWVLVLLIGLLAGVADRRRVWVLGLTFLGVTGAMYFALMAAWLNFVLWLGAVTWLRLAIGALAVAAGLHYLRDYWTNPEGVCAVTGAQGRRRFAQAFGRIVREPNLPLAALGIGALALAVNLVELLCSAGVPAVYTQVLAMQDLTPAAHYAHILLYLAVFLLDDVAIFVIAMLAVRRVGAGGGYARASQALGGGLLLALGAVMVLRPDLLG